MSFAVIDKAPYFGVSSCVYNKQGVCSRLPGETPIRTTETLCEVRPDCVFRRMRDAFFKAYDYSLCLNEDFRSDLEGLVKKEDFAKMNNWAVRLPEYAKRR